MDARLKTDREENIPKIVIVIALFTFFNDFCFFLILARFIERKRGSIAFFNFLTFSAHAYLLSSGIKCGAFRLTTLEA